MPSAFVRLSLNVGFRDCPYLDKNKAKRKIRVKKVKHDALKRIVFLHYNNFSLLYSHCHIIMMDTIVSGGKLFRLEVLKVESNSSLGGVYMLRYSLCKKF